MIDKAIRSLSTKSKFTDWKAVTKITSTESLVVPETTLECEKELNPNHTIINKQSLRCVYACNLATLHTMMVTMWMSLSNAALIDENVPIEQVCPRRLTAICSYSWLLVTRPQVECGWWYDNR